MGTLTCEPWPNSKRLNVCVASGKARPKRTPTTMQANTQRVRYLSKNSNLFGVVAAMGSVPIVADGSLISVRVQLAFPAICLKCLPNFIANASEHGQFLIVRSFRVRGIIEGPVVAIDLTREHWAGLVGVAANGDDRLDRSSHKFVQVL